AEVLKFRGSEVSYPLRQYSL
ncbi:hypothetical protein A2U01_0046711, partial [Trifolium medium]|nr:hypothetical protein [Trifolium medium]